MLSLSSMLLKTVLQSNPYSCRPVARSTESYARGIKALRTLLRITFCYLIVEITQNQLQKNLTYICL
jgi:hypothetical protein